MIGGVRVPKSHLRIEAYGSVDELNSFVGLICDQDINTDIKEVLSEVKERLFTLGANLASDPAKAKMDLPDLHESDIELLETKMDEMNAELPELKNFILPGGHTTISYCHIARCICRRCERIIVGLAQDDFVAPLVIQYLNRLFDYLFVLARKIGKDLNVEEIQWKPRK